MAGQSKRSVVLHDVWGELRVETRDSAGWFVPSLALTLPNRAGCILRI